MESLLEVEDLEVYYGAIHALHAVSIHVKAGEIVALVGANGAGKTSLMHAVMGQIPISGGRIRFDGAEISGQRTDVRVRRGLTLVPEGRRVFPRTDVEDNLLLGAWTRHSRAERTESLEEMYERFPRLRERRRQPAGTLSGGEQQMLSIARALMSKPNMLLLDEPSMGLAPAVVDRIFDIIEEVKRDGVTILLVEQNANRALQIADQGYCLEAGRIVMEGSASGLRDDCRVKEAYLGG